MDFRREVTTITRGKKKGYTTYTKIYAGADKAQGGSDGCVNFEDPDNKGLPSCLVKAGIEKVYEEYCDKASLADFLVIAAEAVTGRLAVGYEQNDPFKDGTLAARFRDEFGAGRTTKHTCPEAKGLMPNPEKGCTDLNDIFIEHIFNVKDCNKHCKWGMTAAISGAHTIGSAKLKNSGYEGNWSDPKN